MSSLYSEIRDSLSTGDLVSWNHVKPTSIFSFILYLYQKLLKPKSVHVGVIVKIADRLLVVEATPPEVRIFPLSRMDNFHILRTNVKQTPYLLDILFKKVGNKYTISNLIKGILGFNAGGNELYCSELANLFYVETGYLDNELYPDSYRTPDDLIDALLKISSNELILVRVDQGNLGGRV